MSESTAEPPRASPRFFSSRGYAALQWICAALASIALLDLAVRAAVRLELRYDTFIYHLPFAAIRGGLRIPFEMNAQMLHRFEGFPPLPHLLQGLLWKLTGSVNGTGVVGFIAYAFFLAYCHFALRARFWLVALISLTAPLVVIHCAASYVDLFGNSLLAIGIASLLYLHLFPERPSRLQLICGALGLVGAAFSKFQLVAVVAAVFILYTIVCWRSTSMAASRKQRFLILAIAAFLAALPYLKNLMRYGNPFWPVRVPFAPMLPFAEDEVGAAAATQTPPPLLGHGRVELFIRSLFEWKLPTSYPDRPRWIIDQGNAWEAFRMGGFWGVGAAIFLLAFALLLFVRIDGEKENSLYSKRKNRRTAVSTLLAAASLLGLTALLPQSHDLRYYLFIPLVWAAAIAMLFPRLEQARPRLAALFLLVVAGMFAYMVSENRTHYRVEKVGLQRAGQVWNATQWWGALEAGQHYCAVDMAPIGILLTGPTLSEFPITDRKTRAECPAGTVVISWDRFPAMRTARDAIDASLAHYVAGRYQQCIEASSRAIAANPQSAMAYNNQCAAYDALGKWDAGIAACSMALWIRPDLQLAKNNLAWALGAKSK